MCSIGNHESTLSGVAPDNENMCRACARLGQTCCQGHDIYVTWGDCRRIAHVFPEIDFFEYRSSQIDDYLDQDHDPLWRQYVFHSDGTRRVLKQDAHGDCLFLTTAGCRLSLAIRPLVCRLFPHLYTADGISGHWDPQCGAAQSKPADLLNDGIAGIARPTAEACRQMLYQEIMWEKVRDENWIDL